MTTTTIPSLPMPCGVTGVFEWEAPDVTGLDPPVRYFDGTLGVIGTEQSSWRSAASSGRQGLRLSCGL
jgi:hypothetical protein